MTTRPFVSLACTMLPGSTRRRPTRPGDRRGDAAVGQVELGAVDLRLVALERAFDLVRPSPPACRAAAGRSSPSARGPGSAPDRAARSSACASSFASCPSACVSCTWNGRGSISASRSPAWTICPSWKATRSSWPSTRLRTVTVLRASRCRGRSGRRRRPSSAPSP